LVNIVVVAAIVWLLCTTTSGFLFDRERGGIMKSDEVRSWLAEHKLRAVGT
jgi:hypothetical protein